MYLHNAPTPLIYLYVQWKRASNITYVNKKKNYTEHQLLLYYKLKMANGTDFITGCIIYIVWHFFCVCHL